MLQHHLNPESHLKRVRIIADYQFGKGAGDVLFPGSVTFQMSTTKRVRQILLEGKRIATVRAHDGMLTLSVFGAGRIHRHVLYPGQRVVVNSDAAPFVAKGKTAFARHVVDADPEIRAGQEVLVVDEGDRLLATGKTMLCALEMKAFEKGTAVDVRGGVEGKDRDGEE
jgi:uncharacterized protein with predicted RNA binding PUA domain